MLGIVFSLEGFHYYVYERHATVETDHKPLESITRKKSRFMRMLLRIQKYDFTVKHVPGKDIPIADGLSTSTNSRGRNDVTIHDITGVSKSKLEKIKEVTKCDETFQILTRTVTNEWPQFRNLKHCNLLELQR